MNSAQAASRSSRPAYESIDVAAALGLDWRDYHLSRKEDGVCVRRQWSGSIVWGDSMPDGRLMVWEIEKAFGQCVRNLPWSGGRSNALDQVFASLPKKLNWHRCDSGHGPEFIEAMINRAQSEFTPDLIVAKPIEASFGVGLVKCKLATTHDCFVVEVHPSKNSIHIAQWCDGQLIDRGWCATFDQYNPGDAVEVECACINRSGKFREPRIYRPRRDKAESDCIFGITLQMGSTIVVA